MTLFHLKFQRRFVLELLSENETVETSEEIIILAVGRKIITYQAES